MKIEESRLNVGIFAKFTGARLEVLLLCICLIIWLDLCCSSFILDTAPSFPSTGVGVTAVFVDS